MPKTKQVTKQREMNNPVPRAQGIKDYNSRNCISSGFFP